MRCFFVEYGWVPVVAVLLGCGGASRVDLTVPTDAGTTDATMQSDGALLPGQSRDGGTPDDAGPGGTTMSLTCGTISCAIPSETCCVSPTSKPPPDFSYGCVSGNGCAQAVGSPGGSKTSALKCSGAANCPQAMLCCVSSVNSVVTSDCKPTCTGGDEQLCDPLGMPTGCASAAPCSSANIGDWGLADSYGTCGGKGT